MSKEIIISDLGRVCAPCENISDKREKDKWCVYNYETGSFAGSMLISVQKGNPKDVELKLPFNGWVRIYVGLYASGYDITEIEMKLSSEPAFMRLSTSLNRTFAEHYVEEVFWRCVQIEEDSIVIGKHRADASPMTAAIAWVRLEIMTQLEIDTYLSEQQRKDTKRIYATNDMHGTLYSYDMSRENAWKTVVQDYIDSDVEWLAIENLSHNNGILKDCEINDFAFAREGDRSFYEQWKKYFSFDVLREINTYGKKMGLKMCVSLRICEWGMEFPHDKINFEQNFAKNNPQFRCVDRDGDLTDYMSFAYDEVQDYIIDEFIKMSETGCDAVQVIFSRGWPFILFEQPFLDMFYERYQEDARVLPLDDERIISLKCEMMNGFMRKLKSSLPSSMELHAKVMFSIYDCLLVGLDVETWAKEGIVQRIISDERRIREVLPKNIFERGKINIERYEKYARESVDPIIRYDYDNIFEPYKDSKGVLKGPKNQKERITEFVELEKYGMNVYIEIMPRCMSTERIKEKALEIYEAGCDHIGLWDTYSRVNRKIEWNMWKRIGHKEELVNFNDQELYKKVRINKIGDKNVRSYKPSWGG